MPEEKDPPRPHGDKLKDAADSTRNKSGSGGEAPRGQRDGAADASTDEPNDENALRRKQYRDGAELVSGID
ncbi:hypothetical protein BH24ACI5_BH24ACI5_18300 [soil metagenome]